MSEHTKGPWAVNFTKFSEVRAENGAVIARCVKLTSLTNLEANARRIHAPGVKLDKGKPRAGLVLGGFSRALLAVADVGTFGAQKYTPHGWLSVPHGIERYTDAMVRHQLAEASGEQTDSESGLSHAAHAAWNALARLELLLAEAKAREAAKRA